MISILPTRKYIRFGCLFRIKLIDVEFPRPKPADQFKYHLFLTGEGSGNSAPLATVGLAVKISDETNLSGTCGRGIAPLAISRGMADKDSCKAERTLGQPFVGFSLGMGQFIGKGFKKRV